jgi:hypothetical protein
MTRLFDGVRKTDVALAVLMIALGVVMMLENVLAGPQTDVRIDSHSWLMVPVFAVATGAILWRRRNVLAVLAVTAAALAVHVVAFGWLVRCGAGLPLSLALAYAAGRLADRWRGVVGLIAVIGIQFLVLVKDSAAGLGIIPVTAAIAAATWGIGLWVRRRVTAGATVAQEDRVGSYA